MTFHTGQQASKCDANHEVSPAESRVTRRPLAGIVLNLTLPKLHLATKKYFGRFNCCMQLGEKELSTQDVKTRAQTED